jgi:hypothetical protein
MSINGWFGGNCKQADLLQDARMPFAQVTLGEYDHAKVRLAHGKQFHMLQTLGPAAMFRCCVVAAITQGHHTSSKQSQPLQLNSLSHTTSFTQSSSAFSKTSHTHFPTLL